MSAADLPVAILAGGLATRLRPITEKIPKLLVEVAGEPFFSHQLRLLKSSGLTKLVLCVGYRGEMIAEQYGDGSEWGVKIDYSFDGEKLLGTGGALVRALPKLGDAFYVLYGDSYLPIDYQAVGRHFLAANRAGLMTVFENHERYDTSNVWFENGLIRVYDKKNKVP
ncbi:MAG TPA: sugar phosphate nucleotidyltransferase, partial [Candidatus Didemnitutus sp.]|nr:sugar phosphate nucleotidyltransferase [Candidatus Didemnitutus sp.]